MSETFRLIAFKPSSHGGRNCCEENYDGAFIHELITDSEVTQRIIDIKSDVLDCCEEGWQHIIVIDGNGADVSSVFLSGLDPAITTSNHLKKEAAKKILQEWREQFHKLAAKFGYQITTEIKP